MTLIHFRVIKKAAFQGNILQEGKLFAKISCVYNFCIEFQTTLGTLFVLPPPKIMFVTLSQCFTFVPMDP